MHKKSPVVICGRASFRLIHYVPTHEYTTVVYIDYHSHCLWVQYFCLSAHTNSILIMRVAHSASACRRTQL
jgi:hypothetical protein